MFDKNKLKKFFENDKTKWQEKDLHDFIDGLATEISFDIEYQQHGGQHILIFNDRIVMFFGWHEGDTTNWTIPLKTPIRALLYGGNMFQYSYHKDIQSRQPKLADNGLSLSYTLYKTTTGETPPSNPQTGRYFVVGIKW